MEDKKTRTITQNASIHLYFKLLAYELNEHGLDVMKVMSHNVPIPWNENLVKELMWRKIQKAMTSKRSTAKLSTTQVSEIYDVINKHLINITDGEISVPFPDKFR
jgi:hypothetical protein